MNSRAVGFSLLLVLGWSTGSWAQVGLVAHYEFDVDFSDSSGNELHGTPIGDAVVVFDDKRGSEVLRLDGSSAAVDLGGSPLFDWSGAFSAAFWINVNAWQGHWDTVLKKESVFSFERNGSNDELSSLSSQGG